MFTVRLMNAGFQYINPMIIILDIVDLNVTWIIIRHTMNEIFNCNWCNTEHQEPFYYDDDYDAAYCSEICVSISESEGIRLSENDMED